MKLFTRPAVDKDTLTERETQVLLRMVEGDTNEQIASLLGLSVKTIKGYIGMILIKAGADNRTQAVSIAFRSGLVQ
jgi:DNA-binding CsgD family transcriptional regulator